MEAVCFLCQDFKANVGHETINCPKSECKNCGQHGHFRINCKFKSMITPWFKAKNAKRFVFTRFLVRKLRCNAHCNRLMGTDLLQIISPHYSDNLFRYFLTKM